MSDPVLWAQAFLISNDAATKTHGPWKARGYQAEMLRDRSLRKVYRCGRRCLPSWIKILDPITGELKTVEELYNRKTANVVAMDEKDYSIKTRESCPVSYNGKKEVYRVKLTDGRRIEATDNHPFYTPDGWKELKDIKTGEFVAVPAELDCWGNREMSDNEVKLLAYYIGTENNRDTIFPRNSNEAQSKDLKEVINSFNCDLTVADDPFLEYHIKRKKIFVFNGAKRTLAKYGVYKCASKNKKIPREIFILPKEQVALFLSRLYSIGGQINLHYPMGRRQRDVEIEYWSSSKELIRGIAHLLLRFGIDYTIEREDDIWRLFIVKKKNIMTFLDNIGLYGEDNKIRRCIKALSYIVDKPEARPPLSNKIIWKKVFSIKSIGMHNTYDLHVPEYHNFVANDIIVHNTGKTEVMIIEGLWKAFTAREEEKRRILYITPYENQVNLIFMRMREFIHDSPLLKNDIKRMINSPYVIEFSNGSMIMGFTTGASSGSGAASVRGQRADDIFCDELDKTL